MKNSLYILFPGMILFFSACEKKDNLTYQERKAVGQYKFEKVTINKDFLKTENITQDYANMILQLNDKKEAALIDQNNSITYTGKFDIVTQSTSNSNNSGSTDNHTIIIDIKSPDRGNAFHWVGEDATFTNNKIRYTVNKADGKYKFRLDKI